MVTIAQTKRMMKLPPKQRRAYLARVDWTVDAKTGRSNSSALFEEIVKDVSYIIGNMRMGQDPYSQARYVVAHLAHGRGMKPTRKP